MPPSFARPELLVLLAAVPVLVRVWVRGRRPAVRYSSVSLVAGLPRGRAGEATVGRATLRGAAVGLVLTAAAGPRTPDLATPVPVEGIAVVLALDISGSMAEPDYPGGAGRTTRLAAAKAAFRAFVLGDGDRPPRTQDRVGLVAFAELPRTVCPPTLDHAVFLDLLAQQTPAVGPAAGTSIGDAVAEALVRLDAAGAGRKVAVVLTDGEENAGGRPAGAALTPRQAAQLARAVGVPVYGVDCGADGPDPARRAAARKTLAQLATVTGGRSFRAADEAGLAAAVAEIDALERGLADPFRYRRYRDWTGAVAAAGLVTLAAGGLLERTRWRVAG